MTWSQLSQYKWQFHCLKSDLVLFSPKFRRYASKLDPGVVIFTREICRAWGAVMDVHGNHHAVGAVMDVHGNHHALGVVLDAPFLCSSGAEPNRNK